MKLNYLDTSNLILLSALKKSFPQRFGEFINEWNSRNFVLALTQTHLIELLKAQQKSTRQAHFDLLTSFIPFRFESENFFQREILLALYKKGFLNVTTETDTSLKIFASVIKNRNEFEMAFYPVSILSKFRLYELIQKAQQYSWKAKSEADWYKSPKPRLANMNKSMFSRSIKKLYAKFIGLDLNQEKETRSIESIDTEFRFRTQIKSTLRKYFGAKDLTTLGNISKNLLLEDCVGLWLRQEVEKNLVKSGDCDYRNEYDLDNIQYLPYVNCLITDKRIVDKTEQVLRRKDLIKPLRTISPPRKTSNSIDLLENILFQ